MKSKEINVAQYFETLDPPNIQNIITNFNKELAEGKRNFKDILMYVSYLNDFSN
jgi:hypothetical protein